MMQTITGNPIYREITRSNKPPSLPIVLEIGGIAGLIVLGLTIKAYEGLFRDPLEPNLDAPPGDIIFVLGMAGLFAIFVAPLIVFIVSILRSRRFFVSDTYELSTFTSVSKARVNLGLFFAIFNKLRWVWAVLIGFIPAITFPGTVLRIVFAQVFASDAAPTPPVTPVVTGWDVVKFTIFFDLIVFGISAISLYLGVVLGRKKNPLIYILLVVGATALFFCAVTGSLDSIIYDIRRLFW